MDNINFTDHTVKVYINEYLIETGNSKNVLNAIQLANEKQAITIGLSGKGGGKLSELAKINLIVKSDDMLTIETIHLLVCHLITTIIRSEGTPKFTY